MKKYRAAVIGLGQIGMGYDYKEQGKDVVTTHASAFAGHPCYDLIGGVDPDGVRRIDFEKKYSRPAFEKIEGLFQKLEPEIVAIAVPTRLHFSVFMQVLEFRPKAIICEKPFSADLTSARKMAVVADRHNIPVLVNYPRRFEPGVAELKKLIESGRLGEIYRGVVLYTKGILNNGSHYIDLLLWLFGDIADIKVLNKGRLWRGSDAEPDLLIKFGKTEVFFIACQGEGYSSIDMELIGKKGKIKYASSGFEIKYWTCRPDPIYPGYTILDPKPKEIRSKIRCSQRFVQQHMLDYLSGKVNNLASSAATALETMKVIDKIFKGIKESVNA